MENIEHPIYSHRPNLQQNLTQNTTLKHLKYQKHQQLQSVLTKLEQMSVQHVQAKIAYKSLKQANKQIQKCQQMIDKISSKLVEKQILSNCSMEYWKMIKMYQQKIHQYRLHVHTKERNYQEYYWGYEGDDDHDVADKIAQQYVPPQAHHVRKFNIQLLYKQKIQKLLSSLTQLSNNNNSNNNNSNNNNNNNNNTPNRIHKARRCNTQDLYNPTPKQINKTSNELQNRKQLRVVANLMYNCVQQEMNIFKQLSQKYIIYQNVFDIVRKQNYGLVGEIKHKGRKKWGANEEEVREMKESIVIV